MEAQATEAKPEIRLQPPSPITGHRLPVRQKGQTSKVARTIREAIEHACKPGACHPHGLAGWLIDRANGGVADRQIFAGMVAKVLPAQIAAQGAGTVVVNLGWLQGRDLGASVTLTAQGERKPLILEEDRRITDQHDHDDLTKCESTAETECESFSSPPPINRQEGGG